MESMFKNYPTGEDGGIPSSFRVKELLFVLQCLTEASNLEEVHEFVQQARDASDEELRRLVQPDTGNSMVNTIHGRYGDVFTMIERIARFDAEWLAPLRRHHRPAAHGARLLLESA